MTTAIVPAGNDSTRFASSMKRFTANHAYKTGDLRKNKYSVSTFSSYQVQRNY